MANNENTLDENLPSYINPHYYEILFSIDSGDKTLDSIISQIIADKILEHGEAVEFLSKDMIDSSAFN